MVYKKNLVACIKVGGKILREKGDEVLLPFGAEYSVLIKNLNEVRVMVKVDIDGKDVGEGRWFIIQPNADLEIERFISNGNLSNGNKFKFIERTEQIEEHRGVKVDDGLVRIEYKIEKRAPIVEHKITYTHDYYDYHYYYPYWNRPHYFCGTLSQSNGLSGGIRSSMGASRSLGGVCAPSASSGKSIHTANMMKSAGSGSSLMAAENSVCDTTVTAGITVPGSESNQQFHDVLGFQTEGGEVIVLHLMGHNGKIPITKPVTVDIRAKCQTCGKRAKKSDYKFCSACGTSLQII